MPKVCFLAAPLSLSLWVSLSLNRHVYRKNFICRYEPQITTGSICRRLTAHPADMILCPEELEGHVTDLKCKRKPGECPLKWEKEECTSNHWHSPEHNSRNLAKGSYRERECSDFFLFFFRYFRWCVRSTQNTTGEVFLSSQMERSPTWPRINGPLHLGLTLTMSRQLQLSFLTSQANAVKTAQAHGVLHIIFDFTGITCSLKKMQSINNHKGEIFLNLTGSTRTHVFLL